MAGAYAALGRKFGTAIGGFFGDDAERAGELAGLKQIALQEQIGATRAHAAAFEADAEKKRLEAQAAQPQSIVTRTLLGMGVPGNNAPDAQMWLDTGRIDKYDAGGLEGPTMPKPEWYTPEIKTKLGQHFAAEQAVIGGGAKNAKDYFEGLGQAELNTGVAKALAAGDMTQFALLHNKDPLKAVQALLAESIRKNEVTPQAGGSRMAATGGKPLFHTDTTGAVLNQYGLPGLPLLDVTNPLAQGTITLRREQAGQARAGAAENYAQAGAANARAAATRASMGGGGGGGGGSAGAATAAGYSKEALDAAAARYNQDGTLPPLGGGKAAAPVRQAILNRAAELPGGDKPPPAKGAGGKPMPPAALKLQQDSLDAIGTAAGIDTDLGAIEQQIKDGKLNFGPALNAAGVVRNAVGLSNENSRNLASFKATMEKQRNDSLRLNKGVQTEGDAVRAWNELFANINDKEVVTQRLAELRRINQRAVDLHRLNVDAIRGNYGAAPLDMGGRTNLPPAVNGGGKAPAGGATRPPLSSFQK